MALSKHTRKGQVRKHKKIPVRAIGRIRHPQHLKMIKSGYQA